MKMPAMIAWPVSRRISRARATSSFARSGTRALGPGAPSVKSVRPPTASGWCPESMDQTADTPAQRAAAGVGDSFDGWGPTLEDQRRCDMPEEHLTTIDEGIRHVQRRQAGDRSGTRAPTDEAIGDSDQGSPEAAEEAGAAAGVVAGTAIAGPIGMIAGAAI